MFIDLHRILSIDHACDGCASAVECCCSKFEICVDEKEVRRILAVLPEVAKLCPRLKNGAGYENIFEETDDGLYAIDTTDNGLCVLAYKSAGKIRCSLHTAAMRLGLPVERVKPKGCVLWPLVFSEKDEILSLYPGAGSFPCNTRRKKPSRRVSPGLLESARLVYGAEFGKRLEREAARMKPPRRRRDSTRSLKSAHP